MEVIISKMVYSRDSREKSGHVAVDNTSHAAMLSVKVSGHAVKRTLRSNARACAMHSYPVAGRENFPRQNLIETIAEPVSREKKIERR